MHSASSNVRTSSTPAQSSSLRPRTKRLISGLSDAGDENGAELTTTTNNTLSASPNRIASPTSTSPFASRSVSPIPAPHPQRPSADRVRSDAQKFAGNSWGRRAQVNAAAVGQRRVVGDGGSPTSPSSLAGLWGTSWTTLQGIASDFLGNDLASNGSGTLKDKTVRQQKRPLGRLSTERAPSTGASSWGPAAPTSHPATGAIGSGTREEREAALRAQKRKDMLTRQDSSYADALGKFKRRLSDDREAMSAPPSENDNRAALVYLHHVKKDDTLAGITIKYNISANVLRKANRMWPNDTVQSRQTLVLPVDACAVKGKPVPGPEALDLLSNEESDALSAGQAEEVPTPTQAHPQPQLPPLLTNGSHSRPRTDSTISATTSRRTSTSATTDSNSESPWHLDSWTLLPGNTQPTEIARLSRRTLGYFPPARRKSNSYSDLDTPNTRSLDLTRASIDSRRPLSPSSSQPQRPPRSRRLSTASTGYFPSYLSGPGGVGTFKSNVHFPGPAQDGLNKMFARHLPDVAPPRNQTDLYQPEMPLYTDEETPIASGTSTPGRGGAFAQNQTNNLNIENVGGAIESWVRRLATKTQNAIVQSASSASSSGSASDQRRRPHPRTSVGTPGRGAGGVGDLIEMTDEFEIGDDDENEEGEEEGEEERGRPGSAVWVGGGLSQGVSATEVYASAAGVKGRARSGGGGGGGGGGVKSGKND